MKKIFKKLTALTLSLVMIFGCIPCFTNNAKAADSNELWIKLQNAMKTKATEFSDDGNMRVIPLEGNGNRIELYTDIECNDQTSGPLEVPSGMTVVLFLEGHKINRKLLADINDGCVIKNEGNLTILTSDRSKNSLICGGYNTGNGGGIYNSGTLDIRNNIELKSNSANKGGAIYNAGSLAASATVFTNNDAFYGGTIYNNKQATLSGVTITKSSALDSGGAIYIESNGSTDSSTISRVEVLQSTITDCKSQNEGGAVCVKKDTVFHIGKEKLGSASKITNCQSVVYNGGAIYSNGAVGLDGVEISNNTACDIGGGIYLGSTGTLFLGAASKVDGNTATISGNNVYMKDGAQIFFGNNSDVQKPTSDMKVGILTEVKPTSDTPVVLVKQAIEDYKGYVVCEESGYNIEFKNDHLELCVAQAPTSRGSKKYKAVDTKDTAEKISGSGKKGSTRTITPIEGKKVSSVIVTDKDGNEIDVTLNEDGTYSFKQPASNVNIEVVYKNREIKLNIGSTLASCDGEITNLDVAPILRNDRTMLPIRFVAENLGAKVEWNELEANMVYITRGDIKIEIKLGSNIAKVNGKEYELDSVAFAENDRTYMPVRFVSEALNAIVEWNESKPNEVKIYEQ